MISLVKPFLNGRKEEQETEKEEKKVVLQEEPKQEPEPQEIPKVEIDGKYIPLTSGTCECTLTRH